MRETKIDQWGIESFDKLYGGLPRSTFNLLRTCNKATQLCAIGHFIEAGLRCNERTVLVGFENASPLFKSLDFYGFPFTKALKEERLIYLYYKDSFSQSLSFTVDYKQIFSELLNIAGSEVNRIAFLNADTLFNLQSHLLARSSAERLTSAVAGMDICILGAYQKLSSSTQEHLDSVALTLLDSYLEICSFDPEGEWSFGLTWHKHQTPKISGDINLFLSQQYGFNPHPQYKVEAIQ